MFAESDKYKNRGSSPHHVGVLHALTVSALWSLFSIVITLKATCLPLVLHLCSASQLKTSYQWPCGYYYGLVMGAIIWIFDGDDIKRNHCHLLSSLDSRIWDPLCLYKLLSLFPSCKTWPCQYSGASKFKHKVGCVEPCVAKFWTCQRMDTSQPLWANCCSGSWLLGPPLLSPSAASLVLVSENWT